MRQEIIDLAGLLGKGIEETEVELNLFKQRVYLDYEGTLVGDELNEWTERLFLQNSRSAYIALKNNPAILVNMLVTGVTKQRDNSSYKRMMCITKYKNNPNLAIFNCDVDEYVIKGDSIIKNSFNIKSKEVTHEEVTDISCNAEKYAEGYYVAPRDSIKRYGLKDNLSYGKEIPMHSFQRDVHGIAEVIDSKGVPDYRKFTLLIRGKNTEFSNLPIPGKTYSVRVLNQTKDGSKEYTFADSPSVTKFVPVDWNPYEEKNFIEEVLKEEFMLPYVRELGDLRDIATAEFDEKGRNRERKADGQGSLWEYTKFNACLFVEADLSKITLYPETETKVSRVVLDDASVEYDLEADNVDTITGWLSDAAVVGLNTGDNSRAIICCYPKIFKPKDKNKANTFSVDVFGILAIEKFKTRFNRQDYEKINSLNEEFDY